MENLAVILIELQMTGKKIESSFKQRLEREHGLFRQKPKTKNKTKNRETK